MKVRDLKKILSDWEEQCKGCTEKSDFIARIKELMPTYAPDAAKVLKERDELWRMNIITGLLVKFKKKMLI